MFELQIPSSLILLAAEAIANPKCGEMIFHKPNDFEWVLEIHLNPSLGKWAKDTFFLILSRPLLPTTYILGEANEGTCDQPERPFVSLDDSIEKTISFWIELSTGSLPSPIHLTVVK